MSIGGRSRVFQPVAPEVISPPSRVQTEQTLRCWLDASVTASVETSGSAVTAWYDQSGTSRHFYQSAAANQPSVGAGKNGLGTVLFTYQFLTANWQTLICPNLESFRFLYQDAGCTVFFVVSPIAFPGGAVAYSMCGNTFSGSTSKSGSRWGWVGTGTAPFFIDLYRDGQAVVQDSVSTPLGSWYVIGQRILPQSSAADRVLTRLNGGGWSTYTGSPMGYRTATDPELLMTVGSAGATASSGPPFAGFRPPTMELAELQFHAGVLTQGEADQRIAALNTKWAVY